MQLLINKN